MRCFISIDLPKNIQEALSSIQTKFDGTDYIFVQPDNFHITLRFLGELKDSLVQDIQKALFSLQKRNPFLLTLTEIGAFPSHEKVRVLWAGVEKTSPIMRLSHDINEHLERFPLEPEEGIFHPHITLGRTKRDVSLPLYDRTNALPQLSFLVTGFNLKQSDLLPDGPAYTTIQEYVFEENK